MLLDHIQWIETFVSRGGTFIVETASKASPSLVPRVQQIFKTLAPWHELQANHPLKTASFLFTQRPEIGTQPIDITVGEGLVWINGELSSAWGIHRPLPRSDIRTAQELGANLLRYIWQRQHLIALSSWNVD